MLAVLAITLSSAYASSRAERHERLRAERAEQKEATVLEQIEKRQVVESRVDQMARIEKNRIEESGLWQKQCDRRETKEIAQGKYAHCHFVPTWPVEARLVSSTAPEVGIETDLSWANSAWSDEGEITDLSALRLGASELQFKDIMLPARIAHDDLQRGTGVLMTGLTGEKTQVLRALSTLPLSFSSHETRARVALTLTKRFFKNRLTIGCALPAFFSRRVLDLEYGHTRALYSALVAADGNGSGKLYQKLGGTAEEITELFLRENNTPYQQTATDRRFGRTELFFQYQPIVPGIELCSVGATLLVPFRPAEPESLLYPALPRVLGESDALGARLFVAAAGKAYKGVTPHLYASFEINKPRSKMVQVCRTYPSLGSALANASDGVVYGDLLSFSPGAAVAGYTDALSPAFAPHTREVLIQDAYVTRLRAGLSYVPQFARAAQIELLYDFALMSRGGTREIAASATVVDTNGEYILIDWNYDQLYAFSKMSLSHTAMLKMRYQVSERCEWSLGASTVIGGRNIPVSYGISANLLYSF